MGTPVAIALLVVVLTTAGLVRTVQDATGNKKTNSQHTAPGMETPELRDSDDLLWALDRDSQSLGQELQRIRKALETSKVPSPERAIDEAIRFMFAQGGILAEEHVKVIGLFRLGIDAVQFSSKGDLVWVVRVSHLFQGVTKEMWISSTTGVVRSMLPPRRTAHEKRGYLTTG